MSDPVARWKEAMQTPERDFRCFRAAEAEERARLAEADADQLAEALLAQHTTLPITSKTAKATAALGRHREALKTRATNDG